LAQHRHDTGIVGLQTYFTSVIDWVGSVFTRAPDKEMCGLEWGRLYQTYHSQSYNASKINARVDELRADPAVRAAKGIYEYVLGGEKRTQLLDIRLFDDNLKRTAYSQQTTAAKAKNVSNCPL